MRNWYKYIMFYRYPGEKIARAFAFNQKQQACNAMDLGAMVIEIVKATSAARSLCSQVNSYPGGMPLEELRSIIDHANPGHFQMQPWDTWHSEIASNQTETRSKTERQPK